jgi:hypothetical protein
MLRRNFAELDVRFDGFAGFHNLPARQRYSVRCRARCKCVGCSKRYADSRLTICPFCGESVCDTCPRWNTHNQLPAVSSLACFLMKRLVIMVQSLTTRMTTFCLSHLRSALAGRLCCVRIVLIPIGNAVRVRIIIADLAVTMANCGCTGPVTIPR